MAVTALPDLTVLPADALRALILTQHEQLLSPGAPAFEFR